MAFFVYVLLNPQGKTYVGQTADLDRHVNRHNDIQRRLTLHTKTPSRSLATNLLPEIPLSPSGIRREA